MMRTLSAELFHQSAALVGEGPSWDSDDGCLVWVDGPAGRVHQTEPDGNPRRYLDVGQHVGVALPRRGGGWLLATGTDFAELSAAGVLTPLLTVTDDARRFNDGKCDPCGRALAGTLAHDRTPSAGALHRLDPGPSATPILTEITLSNGLGWSPDGRIMYHIDTPTRRIRRFGYDLDTGTASDRGTLVEIDADAGLPDGMCVDDAGCIWVALWGGGTVRRYTPHGRLDTVIELPVSRPTSCCFAGDRLFITTAQKGLDAAGLAAEPWAGSVLAATPGITGPAATPWTSP